MAASALVSKTVQLIGLAATVLLINTSVVRADAESTSIIVVSDLHVGSVWFESSARQQKLMSFLDYVESSAREGNGPQTLVLLGDIIELWLTPFYQVPPSPTEAAANQNSHGFNVRAFVKMIQRISDAGVTVVSVTKGNHDMEMNADFARQIYGGNVLWRGDSYEHRNVLFEHGHMYDLFNAEEVGGQLCHPFGYFVSRTVAFTGYTTVKSSNGVFGQFLDDAIDRAARLFWKVLLDNKAVVRFLKLEWAMKIVLETILNHVAEESLLDISYEEIKDVEILAASPYCGDQSSFTLKKAVKKFKGLIKRWLKVHKVGYVAKMLAASKTGDVKYFVQRKTADVVVMGHTHSWKLESYHRDTKHGGKDVVYANSGTWVDGVVPTFVKISFHEDQPNRPSRVEVFKWLGAQTPPELQKSMDVPSPISRRSRRLQSVPPSWICNEQYYDADDGCDCNCGVWDPDCDGAPESDIYNCDPEISGAYCRQDTAQCAYAEAPESWNCPATLYNNQDGCHCMCGAYDPDCAATDNVLFGCDGPGPSDTPVGCFANATCEFETLPPPAWQCEPSFYDADDGCDCACGARDPDCDDEPVVNNCHCGDMPVACSSMGTCICVTPPREEPSSSSSTTVGLNVLLILIAAAVVQRS